MEDKNYISYYLDSDPGDDEKSVAKRDKIAQQNIDNRLSIYNKIISGKLNIPCNKMVNFLDVKKHFVKDSASSSSIFFAELKYEEERRYKTRYSEVNQKKNESFDDNAVVKLTFVATSEGGMVDNSLDVEVVLYKIINRVILEKHVSPHFMTMLAHYRCDYSDSIVPICIKNKNGSEKICDDMEEIVEIDENKIDGNKKSGRNIFSDTVNILILERGRGMAWLNYVEKNTLDERTLYVFLFQLAYSIHAMNSRGIYHGDMHLGNIWYQPVKRQTITYYVNEKTCYEIETDFIIKIYDFDFGHYFTKTQTVINTGFRNIMKDESKYADFYRPISAFYDDLLKSRKYKLTWLQNIFDEFINYNFQMGMDERGRFYLLPSYEDEVEMYKPMKTAEEMLLENSFFNKNFRRGKSLEKDIKSGLPNLYSWTF
jgi:serine/threonine protein kinase